MKLNKFILTILVLVLIGNTAFAAVINQPAATVNLIRNKVITYQDLNDAIASQQADSSSALQILDVLINNEVFLQGAERDGVKVTDSQLNQLVAQQKTYIEQQAGQTFTQDEFNNQVIAAYGSLDNYKQVIKEQYILQTYLVQEKGAELENIPVPTDAEINTFFRKNKTQFAQAENVKLAHVYLEKTGDASKDAAKKAQLETVYNDIKSGKITFEAAVTKYSEDNDSKSVGGEIGWLTTDNTVAYEGWGDTFCDAVIELPVGQVSTVLESKTGYHIVRNSVHNDAKLLALTDRISPESTATVYDYIKSGLYSQNQQTKMAELLNVMVADLRSQAKIRILYK